MIIVEKFCRDFPALREKASCVEYQEINHGPVFYGGIALVRPFSAWAYERFGALLGRPAKPVMEYFRKYELGMVQHGFIHSDRAVSDWTAVLSLRDDNGALCFWRHLATNWIEPDDSDLDSVAQASADGMDEARWRMIEKIDMSENRCVIYKASLFHSRWPKDWDNADPRLVHVFFFNLI